MAEEKILIADDDPAVRRLLIRVVEGSGCHCLRRNGSRPSGFPGILCTDFIRYYDEWKR